MAVREHSCTRRDLLGAALIAPVALQVASEGGMQGTRQSRVVTSDGLGCAAPPAGHCVESTHCSASLCDPSAVRGRLGRWRRASAAVARAEAAMDASYAAQDGARSREEVFALEEVYSDRLCDFYGAVRRLLRTPAPDVAALAVKVCLVVDHEVATLEGAAACMAVLKADATRLSGQSGTLTQA